MRTPERRTIAGTSYEITPLPARESARTALRLGKLLAPGLSTLQSVPQVLAALLGALGELLARADADEVLAIMAVLAKATQVEIAPGRWVVLADHFDAHFAGDQPALWRWFWTALEVEYGPLLTALLAATPASLRGRAASPAPPSSPAAATA